MEQLLGNKQSKFNTKVDNYVNLDIDSNFKDLPKDEIVESINAYDQYIKECDESDKYRLLFSINPICSNVLFNHITEIVYHEGGDDCVFFGYNGPKGCTGVTGTTIEGIENYHEYTHRDISALTRYNLIRDTAYSHKDIGPLVYHCGYDIFNNHTLRRKGFSVVNKMSDTFLEASGSTVAKYFNTIQDYARDNAGDVVIEKSCKIDCPSAITQQGNRNPSDYKPSSAFTPVHLYQYDNLDNFVNTLDKKLIETDGWFGFINPSTLEIENYASGISINKCMNNNKYAEQIDMYPDRSLFSFLPKENKLRGRQEYNWDYCLTYPYKSDINNPLVSSGNVNGLECRLVTNIFSNENRRYMENMTVRFRTLINNGFKDDDTIKLYIIKNSDGSIKESICNILKVDEDDRHYFEINSADFYDNLDNIYKEVSEEGYDDTDDTVMFYGDSGLTNNYSFRVGRVSNGTPVKYYLRKFRRLPNFADTNVLNDNQVTEDEIKYSGKTFSSSLTKIAFARNIYNENAAQIIFNDDIVTTGIKDNLGRQVSEIYLTVVKRNKGHEKWYSTHAHGLNYTDNDIEFSHCFGDITSGFKTADDAEDYNIRKIHSVDYALMKYALFDHDLEPEPHPSGWAPYNLPYKSLLTESAITESPQKLESGITIDSADFYGDIVEFDINKLEETTIEEVYHRFNTAQREWFSYFAGTANEYDDIFYDDMTYDDYDVYGSGLTFQKKKLNVTILNSGYSQNQRAHMYYGNIDPEGYFYKPHYKIKLFDYNTTLNQGQHTRVAFTLKDAEYAKLSELLRRYNSQTNVSLRLANPNLYTFTPEEKILFDLNGDGRINVADKVCYDSIWQHVSKRGWTTLDGRVGVAHYFDIHTPKNYYLEVNDELINYNKVTGEKSTCKVVSVSGVNFSDIKIYSEEFIDPALSALFKPNREKPATAYEMNDGTGRYLWRDKKSWANVKETDEIYEQIFTNGAHYVHKNINFYLHRQGEDLSTGSNVVSPVMKVMTIKENHVDVSSLKVKQPTENKGKC